MDDCTHLGPDARAVIGQSADARIDWLAQERWIGYSRAQEALAQLTRLLNHPPTHRMPNLLLLGYTNNGKTTIVRYFAEQHPARDDPEGDALHYPVVMIQMPQVPQEQRFYEELLDS